MDDFQEEEQKKTKRKLGRRDVSKEEKKEIPAEFLQKKDKIQDKSEPKPQNEGENKKDGKVKDAKEEGKKPVKKAKVKKVRSKRYQALLKKIDRNKLYSPKKAIELLLSLSKSKIDETVEIHISTLKDKVTGEVKLPHGTGKSQKIVVFKDSVLKLLAKGKIDFDMLVAKPADMPKLAKFAKILGPKGLFPNPKNGTISDSPEKTVKELQSGKTHFKTEPKFPLIHFTLGKISFGEKKLLENLDSFLKALGYKNIKKATLSSTHSPGIKLRKKD